MEVKIRCKFLIIIVTHLRAHSSHLSDPVIDRSNSFQVIRTYIDDLVSLRFDSVDRVFNIGVRLVWTLLLLRFIHLLLLLFYVLSQVLLHLLLLIGSWLLLLFSLVGVLLMLIVIFLVFFKGFFFHGRLVLHHGVVLLEGFFVEDVSFYFEAVEEF